MSLPKNPIFRDNAVKHYLQSRNKDTLPRFISLPVALFFWVLLGLLLVVGLLAWYEQIPSYISGHGVVLSSNYVSGLASNGEVVSNERVVSNGGVVSNEGVISNGRVVSNERVVSNGGVVSNEGVISNGGVVSNEGVVSNGGTLAVAFFALDQAHQLHAGQHVFVRFASSTQSLTGTLLTVDPMVSPALAVLRYGLGNDGSYLITEPSAAAIIRLDTTSPSSSAGSILTADVQVGSCSIISLLPGIGGLLGK